MTLPALAQEVAGAELSRQGIKFISGSAGDRDEEMAALDRRRWFRRDRGDVET